MKKYIVYGLQVLLFLFFIAPGIMKLTGQPSMVELFERLGYPIWCMYFVGLVELTGALGIAFGSFINKILPKLAAGGLILVMVGAFVSHLMVDDPFTAAAPALVNLVLLNVFLYLLKKQGQQIVEEEKEQAVFIERAPLAE